MLLEHRKLDSDVFVQEDFMAAGLRYRTPLCYIAALIWLASLSGLSAQQSSAGPAALTPVPRLVWFSGSFHPADGLPIARVESVTLAVYSDQQGGEALWQETQNVVVGADGRYNLLMGSTLADGLPPDLFTTGEPRWLGVRFNRPGEVDQSRVLFASVPYALKAVDADTLGGKPASAYLLAEPPLLSGTSAGSGHLTALKAGNAAPAATSGTAGFIGKFIDGTSLGNSTMFQGGNLIGVGTTSPLDSMHVSFNDATGGFTGYAVQNLSGGASAYSGMLFYDQFGALGQFQGFNNVTHEYRINNVAAGGTINFMIGSSSKFQVASNGNVQIAGNVTVNGNIGAKYQDVAEWVETPSPLEAGTVVIVDPMEPNRVLQATKAYDTRVAGAVSREPGLVLGERSDSKAMVAQSGRVRVKADATYGAITIGDLLVTSPTPGYAMRSRPMRVGGQSLHRPGTLLGKALEALPSGKGEILVLLTLQ
jgi:hypothetical protein